MNPKLRGLLIAVGAVATAISTVLWVPAPGVTKADLVDAGITVDCNKRQRTCLRFSDDGSDCPDGGPYCEFVAAAMVCAEADGGRSVATTRAILRGIVDDSTWCGSFAAGALAADSTADAPFSCACSSGSNCTVGGNAAPTGVTLQPGWTGAGCIPKPCLEVWGRTSWPAGCPL